MPTRKEDQRRNLVLEGSLPSLSIAFLEPVHPADELLGLLKDKPILVPDRGNVRKECDKLERRWEGGVEDKQSSVSLAIQKLLAEGHPKETVFDSRADTVDDDKNWPAFPPPVVLGLYRVGSWNRPMSSSNAHSTRYPMATMKTPPLHRDESSG